MPSTPRDTSTSRALHVRGGGDEDFTPLVERFKAEHGIHFVLAFSGGADDDSPLLRHVREQVGDSSISVDAQKVVTDLLSAAGDTFTEQLVSDILHELEGLRIAVLTGGTRWGVPRIATNVARKYGFPTIGVYPLRAFESDALADDLLDLSICVHPLVGESQWGDESPIFAKILDAAVVIGGGAGTMVEVAHLLKLNEKYASEFFKIERLEARGEYDEADALRAKLSRHKLRHILPVHGTGGTADKVSFFPGKPETMALSVPNTPLVSGHAVYQHICNILPSSV